MSLIRWGASSSLIWIETDAPRGRGGGPSASIISDRVQRGDCDVRFALIKCASVPLWQKLAGPGLRQPIQTVLEDTKSATIVASAPCFRSGDFSGATCQTAEQDMRAVSFFRLILPGRAQLVSCVHDEIIVECDAADAEMIRAEVQAIMETRSAQIFNGQKIGVEAHVEDNWAGVKLPMRSTFPKNFETKSLER